MGLSAGLRPMPSAEAATARYRQVAELHTAKLNRGINSTYQATCKKHHRITKRTLDIIGGFIFGAYIGKQLRVSSISPPVFR